ncbi:alpha-keto acid decarboxylase family protein [Calycomorphotria hydatis]|uniref:Indole-3-pyruvate decarboxylase n=1 Tax=Calycomorphotria hydatis TaxID=2528027 RepID=A0A517T7S0_9PLAN|nr:thiamine pyrophosphate-binding protein [Calycomorphotria hydatis]QDT64417.1 Indole-3-pyruvate decarboxylase [Calycomorphotria hydatis]
MTTKQAKSVSASATKPSMTKNGAASQSKKSNGKHHSNGATKPTVATDTIGGYLIQRLQDYGLRDMFGIPGDFVLNFYGMLEESPIRVIGTTREDNAGYAADAYARVHGLGAVCVTYCVGGLSLCNSIAGAYAEKSPVVVISGAPGIGERQSDPLLHHRVRDFGTQRDVFEKITVANGVLDDPLTAFREIDRCLEAAVHYKRPVYLELPRDRVTAKALYPHTPSSGEQKSDPDALHEALEEAGRLIQSAKKPIIIAGVEMHRFGLREEVLKLAEENSIPMSATLLGKSVISEKHPLYIGVYEGAMGRETVTKYVEESDCVILLGTFMTDINLGIYTAHLDPGRCVYATSEKLRIRHHHYHDVVLSDFVKGLAEKKKMAKVKRPLPKKSGMYTDFKIEPDAPVTVKQLFGRINRMLGEEMVVIADVGDSLFGSVDLSIHQHTEFLSPAYYTSMGFAVPASVGVQVANPALRPLVLVGDGAFQMTGQELSTSLRHGFNPIVVVLNNHGYTTERFLQEGPFNDIHNWAYHRMPDLLGGGWGFEVRTEGELDQALNAALANQDAFSILNVHLQPTDTSPALQRLAEKMSKTV